MYIDIKDLEAIIFLSEKAIPYEDLMSFFEVDLEYLHKKLLELKELKENTGINLLINNRSVKFITNPICGELVSKFFNPSTKVKKLSKTSMETLTIIAVKGPITKTEIEEVKGMNVDGSLQVLLEKKLVHSVSRKKSLGNPKLYEVTENFYAYVGLESKEELEYLRKNLKQERDNNEDK